MGETLYRGEKWKRKAETARQVGKKAKTGESGRDGEKAKIIRGKKAVPREETS